jgi:hypothetical protein
MINKQIQQKMYPRLTERLIETRPPPTGVTYAQVAQGQTELPQTNVPQPSHNEHGTYSKRPNRTQTNDDQMGTFINLITVLISKIN